MEGSYTFLSCIICIGLFLGISLSIFLLFNKSVKNKSNIYLAVLVICATFWLLAPFVYFAGWLDQLPHVYRSERFGSFIIGPVSYFYVCACTQKDFKMRPILWLHFLPVIPDLLTGIPIYTLSAEDKIIHFQNFMETGIFKGINELRFVPIVKVLVAMGYGLLCINLILKYRKHLTETASSVDHSYSHWLLILTSFRFYPFLIVLVWLLFDNQLINLNLVYSSVLFFILTVFAAILLKPELFHAFPHQIPLHDTAEEKKQKYESSNLQTAQKEKYLERLQTKMKSEKYYEAPELTIQQLSDQINIPTYYLSQIINEKLNVNFLQSISSRSGQRIIA